jgi:hypothetical protein
LVFLLGLGEVVVGGTVSLALGEVVGDADDSLGLGAAVVSRDFSLGLGEAVAGWAVILGLAEVFLGLAVLLGEVVLVLDLMTLGIAFGKTFSSGLPVADGDGVAVAGDEVDAAGEGLGERERCTLAEIGGDDAGSATEGLGADSLGLAAIGLSDTFGWSVFWALSVVVWVPGMGISRSSACKPRATITDGLIIFIQDPEFSDRSTLSNLLNIRLKLSETTQPSCHG